MRLEDKTLTVTGASSGIGRELASDFVSEGGRVVCVSRSEDRLVDTLSYIETGPGEALLVEADVREWTDVEALVETALDAYGSVDVLVNNAGVNQRTITGGHNNSVANVPIEHWDAILETNLSGVFYCTKAVLPTMLEADSGVLIHLSSRLAKETWPNWAPYVASKFGLEGFASTLACELADTGVTSMTLRPPSGGVTTDSRSFIPETERQERYDPDVLSEGTVQLAVGAGQNGGRYVGTPDGDGFDVDARWTSNA
jgi:NAD(P)-dependent dehydrogenase (short-subunit alcohol dehydrogenase family)